MISKISSSNSRLSRNMGRMSNMSFRIQVSKVNFRDFRLCSKIGEANTSQTT